MEIQPVEIFRGFVGRAGAGRWADNSRGYGHPWPARRTVRPVGSGPRAMSRKRKSRIQPAAHHGQHLAAHPRLPLLVGLRPLRLKGLAGGRRIFLFGSLSSPQKSKIVSFLFRLRGQLFVLASASRPAAAALSAFGGHLGSLGKGGGVQHIQRQQGFQAVGSCAFNRPGNHPARVGFEERRVGRFRPFRSGSMASAGRSKQSMAATPCPRRRGRPGKMASYSAQRNFPFRKHCL